MNTNTDITSHLFDAQKNKSFHNRIVMKKRQKAFLLEQVMNLKILENSNSLKNIEDKLLMLGNLQYENLRLTLQSDINFTFPKKLTSISPMKESELRNQLSDLNAFVPLFKKSKRSNSIAHLVDEFIKKTILKTKKRIKLLETNLKL